MAEDDVELEGDAGRRRADRGREPRRRRPCAGQRPSGLGKTRKRWSVSAGRRQARQLVADVDQPVEARRPAASA